MNASDLKPGTLFQEKNGSSRRYEVLFVSDNENVVFRIVNKTCNGRDQFNSLEAINTWAELVPPPPAPKPWTFDQTRSREMLGRIYVELGEGGKVWGAFQCVGYYPAGILFSTHTSVFISYEDLMNHHSIRWIDDAGQIHRCCD